MLETIRIQNFRSLKNVTLDLKKINLLIGANNSGKSNFLKALKFFGEFADGNKPSRDELIRSTFNHSEKLSVKFTLLQQDEFYKCEFIYISDSNEPFFNEIIGAKVDSNEKQEFGSVLEIFNERYTKSGRFVANIRSLNESLDTKQSNVVSSLIDRLKKISDNIDFDSDGFLYDSVTHDLKNINYSLENYKDYSILYRKRNITSLEKKIDESLSNLKIYNPDPNKIHKENILVDDILEIDENTSNIVSVLDNIKDEFPSNIDIINIAINTCLPEFSGLRFKKIKNNGKTIKKWGLANHKNKIFWAEDLSEGVLYFVAILAIIHQPNPPKLLLLEELEKGIHPRRIGEVIDYLEQLAEDKDIQIILTTHSPIVVDRFSHSPESIFVFDKEDDATVVQNLAEIIKEKNDNLEAQNLEKINYEESLGEYWLMGFLNGVPND
ncbi:MAG: putative ATPase [Flammeovirgaceae bacterium]|jgi:predicted ATPase